MHFEVLVLLVEVKGFYRSAISTTSLQSNLNQQYFLVTYLSISSSSSNYSSSSTVVKSCFVCFCFLYLL